MREIRPDEIPINLTSDDAVVIRVPDSSRLLLVFTGFARRVGITLQDAYAYFARYRINVVILADDSQAIYLHGIKSLGDSLGQTLDGLRGLMNDWRIHELMTFGSSAGGYGAMLYGTHLGARRVLSIAGPGNLDPAFDRRVHSFSRVELLREIEKTTSLDLTQIIPTFANPPRIDCYYALDCAEDAAQARHLASLRNVVLHPIDKGGHSVITLLHRDGLLQAIFDETFLPAN
jgi:hypothetical protein